MIEWFYLSFGFALLFTFLRREDRRGLRWPGVREIGFNACRLVVGVGILTILNSLFTFFLWGPAGRNDFGWISFFLWALILDEGMNHLKKEGREKEEIPMIVSPSFLALVGFSLWIVEKGSFHPSPQRFLWGLGLPLGTAVLEWLLEGLRNRVRLSSIPTALEGAPILFWLAMLLSLAFWGLGEMARNL